VRESIEIVNRRIDEHMTHLFRESCAEILQMLVLRRRDQRVDLNQGGRDETRQAQREDANRED
jgi:hypothetical protein